MIVYNESVRGFSHIKNQTRMEDYSDSYQNVEKNGCIIAVADGHGDSRCFRSHIGSKLAVEVAVRQFKDFMDALDARPDTSIEKLENTLYSIFSNNIFKGWKKACFDHYNEHPFTEEEIETHFEGDVLHAYGTTLIAAMQFKNILIVIQQGDGHVVMIYEDGHADMPVALDERCIGNVTTSLCDPDAEEKFSFSVFDIKRDKIAACFLGTDGVEDSFSNDELTMSFYMKLAKEFLQDNFSLAQDLSNLSKLGSHDDISIACIYDKNLLASHADIFDTYIQSAEKKEMLRLSLIELHSKERKKSFYEKKMIEWQEKNKSEKDEFENQIQLQLQNKKNELCDVNEQLKIQKKLKPKKENKKKSKMEVIKELLNSLDKENKKNVQFLGTEIILVKDRRYAIYKKIRQKAEGVFEFPFEDYENIFSEDMSFEMNTMVCVEHFVKDLEAFLKTVKIEEKKSEEYDADLYKQLNSQKKCLQAECSNLEKQLGTYKPGSEYIEFKDEYNTFMQEYKKLEKKCRELEKNYE